MNNYIKCIKCGANLKEYEGATFRCYDTDCKGIVTTYDATSSQAEISDVNKGSDVTASQLKISDSCIPPESFTLSLDREEPPIIIIDKEGFKYKGELVEDKGEIYQLFKNYLTSLQTISDEEIDNAWEEFRVQNPNTVGGFQDQYDSFLFAIKWYREKIKLKA
jgi:hypothetical protein